MRLDAAEPAILNGNTWAAVWSTEAPLSDPCPIDLPTARTCVSSSVIPKTSMWTSSASICLSHAARMWGFPVSNSVSTEKSVLQRDCLGHEAAALRALGGESPGVPLALEEEQAAYAYVRPRRRAEAEPGRVAVRLRAAQA